jgi:hypothetical protein
MPQDKKITDLTSLTSQDLDLGNDFLAIVDSGENETKKITPSNLLYSSVKSDNINNIIQLTRVEYNAITTPDPNTLYIISAS